jgi:5'-phosphate synthase pdxT subunit
VSVTRVGILALQGDFAAHAAVLSELDARPVEVRRCAQLDSIDGLIIPGGESTTLLNLMEDEPWFDTLRSFHAGGGAIFGTCAGAILLAREVVGPSQPSLGLMDVVVRRNGYGRQVDSFEESIELTGDAEPLQAVFIRAPRFELVGKRVEICARRQGEPVLVRQERLLAGTFHPELTGDRRLHLRFLALMRENEDYWTPGQEAHAVSGCGS